METFDVSLSSQSTTHYFVYVLFSMKDRGLYIGYTHDLNKRYVQHMRCEVYSTKYRQPLMMIFYETFISKKDAKAREEFLKSGFGREQLKKCLSNTLSNLKK